MRAGHGFAVRRPPGRPLPLTLASTLLHELLERGPHVRRWGQEQSSKSVPGPRPSSLDSPFRGRSVFEMGAREWSACRRPHFRLASNAADFVFRMAPNEEFETARAITVRLRGSTRACAGPLLRRRQHRTWACAPYSARRCRLDAGRWPVRSGRGRAILPGREAAQGHRGRGRGLRGHGAEVRLRRWRGGPPGRRSGL